jgi:hypothetical protein
MFRSTAIALRMTLAFTAPVAAQQASPQPTPDARQAVETACRGDLERLCKGVQPGGGRIMACLREKQDQVGAPCKEAIAKARAAR